MAGQMHFKYISNKEILVLYDTSIKILWNASNSNLVTAFEKSSFL